MSLPNLDRLVLCAILALLAACHVGLTALGAKDVDWTTHAFDVVLGGLILLITGKSTDKES